MSGDLSKCQSPPGLSFYKPFLKGTLHVAQQTILNSVHELYHHVSIIIKYN